MSRRAGQKVLGGGGGGGSGGDSACSAPLLHLIEIFNMSGGHTGAPKHVPEPHVRAHVELLEVLEYSQHKSARSIGAMMHKSMANIYNI